MENQQTTVQPQPLPPPTKTNVWMVISLILLTIIIVGGAVYLWLTGRKTEIVVPPQEIKSTPTVQAEITQTSTISPVLPKFISLDETWNQYSDPVLGFTLKVPKMMIEPYASCKYVDTNGDHSYRPQEGALPVKFFSNDGMVYLASEYTYQLSGETADASGRTFFSKCDKTPNNVAILSDRENYHSPLWQIIVKTISSDPELEQFLKNRYGEGCKLGEKKAFSQEGVFDIQIEGDGLDLGETKCPINYMTKVLYSPTRKKVAAWDIGQACSFFYPNFDNCKDMEMVNSFRFE